nr:hypothetical protein [Wolbachia pipientis]
MHNKGWIPVPSTGMTSQGHWDDTCSPTSYRHGISAANK